MVRVDPKTLKPTPEEMVAVYVGLKEAALQRAGGKQGFDLLGPALRHAVVAEEVLSFVTVQLVLAKCNDRLPFTRMFNMLSRHMDDDKELRSTVRYKPNAHSVI